jgi:heme-degrading monooxygenase HmoA
MYVIIWEYQVRADGMTVFRESYSPTGAWAKLFQKSKGYLGTELLSDEEHPHRFMTIDRWTSSQEYAAFHAEWKDEYAKLDAECEGLTEAEMLVGKWERS